MSEGKRLVPTVADRYRHIPDIRVDGGDIILTPGSQESDERDPVIWMPPPSMRGVVRGIGWVATALVVAYFGGLWLWAALAVGQGLAKIALQQAGGMP